MIEMGIWKNVKKKISFSLGTERSSIYVAMCILVQHLRTEKKVDICTTTRKLRSQRNMLLDTYVSTYSIQSVVDREF